MQVAKIKFIGKKIALIVFFLIISRNYFAYVAYDLSTLYSTKKWPQQNALVLKSTLRDNPYALNDPFMGHCADIRIGFIFQGKSFSSDLETKNNCQYANYLLTQYPQGATVATLVNPKKPTQTRSLDFPNKSLPWLEIVFCIFMLYMLGNVLIWKPENMKDEVT